jgi:DNA modification methylase
VSYRKEVLAEGVELYLGDCLEVLPSLGRFDLCLTDPPFGINRDKGFGTGGHGKGGAPRRAVKRYVGGWDNERPPPEIFSHILERSSSCIIWGAQFFADLLPPNGKWLWWDKLQTMPSYGDGELAWTNISGTACKKFTLGLNAMIARGETGLHPTQKPLALMEWCIDTAPSPASVLDPFMGSCGSGVAAVKRGLCFTGIEIDPGYFETACRRIEAALQQPDMFVPSPAPLKQTSMFSEDAA